MKRGFQYDFIDEFVERWNRNVRRMRIICLVLAAILIIMGILCAAFPMEVFAVVHYTAAAALVLFGIYHIYSYASTTYYFRNAVLLVLGILNVLLGVMVFLLPPAVTAGTIVFMLALMLLFGGAERISFASKLKYFQILNTRAITVEGILSIILGIVFLLIPYFSALALSYVIAAYLIVTGISLIAEAAGMKKI